MRLRDLADRLEELLTVWLPAEPHERDHHYQLAMHVLRQER
jgi:hypothetical protein